MKPLHTKIHMYQIVDTIIQQPLLTEQPLQTTTFYSPKKYLDPLPFANHFKPLKMPLLKPTKLPTDWAPAYGQPTKKFKINAFTILNVEPLPSIQWCNQNPKSPLADEKILDWALNLGLIVY